MACGGQLAEPPPDAATTLDAATSDGAVPDAATPVMHCTATTTTTLASDQRGYRVALDDAYVYWVTIDDDVRRVAKGGGPVDELGTVSGHGTLVPSASSLYVGPGDVVRVPKNGGAAQTVAQNTQAFAVDAAETTLVFVTPSPTTIFAQPLPSGTATVVAKLSYGDTVSALAVPGDGYAYYGTETAIARVPLAGGPIEPLAPGYLVETFAFDATTLFFAQQDGHGASQILRVPRSGGASTFMTSTTAPREIGVSDSRIFWADTTTLWAQSKTSGWPKAIGPTQQASGLYVAPSLAIDGACLYWASADPGGAIFAMPIPAQ